MDIIEATQQAHDEFVRAVQKVAGHDAKGLGEPLEVFHEAARAVDVAISKIKLELADLTTKRDQIKQEIDDLTKED